VFATLADANATSPLPAEPPETAVADVEAWLVALRRDHFAGQVSGTPRPRT
jgi:hypothetical protein